MPFFADFSHIQKYAAEFEHQYLGQFFINIQCNISKTKLAFLLSNKIYLSEIASIALKLLRLKPEYTFFWDTRYFFYFDMLAYMSISFEFNYSIYVKYTIF